MIVSFSSYSQEKEKKIAHKWKLIDDPECPDFINLKKDGRYIISNDCSVKETDTIYHSEIFVVEKGNWKLKKSRLLLCNRKVRQFSNFHEYHGVKKELLMKIKFKSKDTLLLFFKKNGSFNLKKFETYIRVN